MYLAFGFNLASLRRTLIRFVHCSAKFKTLKWVTQPAMPWKTKPAS